MAPAQHKFTQQKTTQNTYTRQEETCDRLRKKPKEQRPIFKKTPTQNDFLFWGLHEKKIEEKKQAGNVRN